MEKECFKCHRTLPLGDFYAHKQMADGHLGKCKKCTRVDVKEHREKNIEKIREYDRNRGNRQGYEYVREYRKQNHDKYKAHMAVRDGIRSGFLIRGVCEVCGSINTHGHHDDYTKPLSVRWLCPPHHQQVHAKDKMP